MARFRSTVGPFNPGLAMGSNIAEGAEAFLSAYTGARDAQAKRELAQAQMEALRQRAAMQAEALRQKFAPQEIDVAKLSLISKAMQGGFVPEDVGTSAYKKIFGSFMDKLDDPQSLQYWGGKLEGANRARAGQVYASGLPALAQPGQGREPVDYSGGGSDNPLPPSDPTFVGPPTPTAPISGAYAQGASAQAGSFEPPEAPAGPETSVPVPVSSQAPDMPPVAPARGPISLVNRGSATGDAASSAPALPGVGSSRGQKLSPGAVTLNPAERELLGKMLQAQTSANLAGVRSNTSLDQTALQVAGQRLNNMESAFAKLDTTQMNNDAKQAVESIRGEMGALKQQLKNQGWVETTGMKTGSQERIAEGKNQTAVTTTGMKTASGEKIALTKANAQVKAAGIRSAGKGGAAAAKADPVLKALTDSIKIYEKGMSDYFSKNPGMSIESASQRDARFKGLQSQLENAKAQYQNYTGKPWGASSAAPAAPAAPAAGRQVYGPPAPPAGSSIKWDGNPASKPAVKPGDVLEMTGGPAAGKSFKINAAGQPEPLTIP